MSISDQITRIEGARDQIWTKLFSWGIGGTSGSKDKIDVLAQKIASIESYEGESENGSIIEPEISLEALIVNANGVFSAADGVAYSRVSVEIPNYMGEVKVSTDSTTAALDEAVLDKMILA